MRHLLFIQVCPFYYLIFRKRRKAAADLKREQDEQALVDGEEDMDVNDDDATKVSVCWMIIGFVYTLILAPSSTWARILDVLYLFKRHRKGLLHRMIKIKIQSFP